MKSVAALLLVGMLILWTELPTGTQGSCGVGGERTGTPQLLTAWSKQLLPLAGSAWSCPVVRITCAMVNPPNQCSASRPCPWYKKCCPSYCGMRCLSRPSSLSLSYG
ncbi:ELAF protein, partial [Psophia crepitans]|nr:ELAF protein [Psophia crepitans]